MKPELIIAKLIDLTDELQETLANHEFGEEYDIMQTYFNTIHEAYRTLLLDLANLAIKKIIDLKLWASEYIHS